jgi:hypothetical protein
MIEVLLGGLALLVAISLAAAIAPKRSAEIRPWRFERDLSGV